MTTETKSDREQLAEEIDKYAERVAKEMLLKIKAAAQFGYSLGLKRADALLMKQHMDNQIEMERKVEAFKERHPLEDY